MQCDILALHACACGTQSPVAPTALDPSWLPSAGFKVSDGAHHLFATAHINSSQSTSPHALGSPFMTIRRVYGCRMPMPTFVQMHSKLEQRNIMYMKDDGIYHTRIPSCGRNYCFSQLRVWLYRFVEV